MLQSSIFDDSTALLSAVAHISSKGLQIEHLTIFSYSLVVRLLFRALKGHFYILEEECSWEQSMKYM